MVTQLTDDKFNMIRYVFIYLTIYIYKVHKEFSLPTIYEEFSLSTITIDKLTPT